MASAVVSGPSAFYTTPDHAAAARNILPQPCAHSPSLSASLFRAEDWAAEIKLLDGGVGELEDELYDTQLGAGRIVSYAYEPDLAFTAVAWLGQQRRDFQHNLHHAARVDPAFARGLQRDHVELSESLNPGGDDDAVSDGDSWLRAVDFGARSTNGGVVTSAAAAAGLPAPADSAAAPSQRPQRACVLKRADLAAVPPPPVAAAPAPAVARKLPPAAAGIAKKAKHPPPAAPVYGIGGSVPFTDAEKAEFVRGIAMHRCVMDGRNTHGYSWSAFIRRAMHTDELPLWKLRVRGLKSKVPRKLYERMLANGEI